MLVDFAEQELREAGLFDQDSDYAGGIGGSVMELMRVFSAQGHSGGSAPAVISLFTKLAMFQPIMPLRNPMERGEYIDLTDISDGNPVFQSNRKSSVFSDDGGKTWYDIDKRIPWWKRRLGVRRAYIKF